MITLARMPLLLALPLLLQLLEEDGGDNDEACPSPNACSFSVISATTSMRSLHRAVRPDL